MSTSHHTRKGQVRKHVQRRLGKHYAHHVVVKSKKRVA